MLLLMDSTAALTRNTHTAKLMSAAAGYTMQLLWISTPVAIFRDFVNRQGVRGAFSTDSVCGTPATGLMQWTCMRHM